MTIHVAHWIWNLTIGGDAKNLLALAEAQSKWARISILTRSPSSERGDHGFPTTLISGIDSQAQVDDFLCKSRPDLVIMHRNGREDPVETEILRVFASDDIPCFEYNTFARPDPSTDLLWAGHAHLSRASLLQYARRLGKDPLSLSKHAAIGYALEIPAQLHQEESLQARASLGLRTDDFVIARILRPDLRKWDPVPILALSRLAASQRKFRMIIQSAPPERHKWIKDLCADSAIILPPTSDTTLLRQTLAASDCFVNYSGIGETFGLAMAEAMSLGLPVVTNSTPSMDNAQVELCQHNTTGLIANSVSSLSQALRYLADNPEQRKTLGSHAREYISATFAQSIVEACLRNFIIQSLGNQMLAQALPPAPADNKPYALTQSWLEEYEVESRKDLESKTSWWQNQIDSQYIKWLRTMDSFDYLRSLGLNEATRSISRRLQSGSLKRN